MTRTVAAGAWPGPPYPVRSALRFAPVDLRERRFRGLGSGLDLGLPTAEPQSAARAERDALEQVDRRGLLGHVRSDRGIRRGVELEDVERLAAHDHVAEAHLVVLLVL